MTDPISRAELGSVAVTIYRSPNDYAYVVEVDTQPDTGEVRFYINDRQIFAGDPEDEGWGPKPGPNVVGSIGETDETGRMVWRFRR